MLKSYNFWIRLVAVLVLLLRIIGSEFGFSVDSGLIIDLATAIASVLVVLGVIQVPVQKIDTSVTVEDKNKDNLNGGDFMKTFEQIKEDLLIVKEKIESSVNKENTIAGEIGAIIDGIISEEENVVITTGEEVKEESKTEEINEIVEEVSVSDDTTIIESEVINEEDGDREVETVIITESDEKVECAEVADDFTEKLVEDAVSSVNEFISEDERARIDANKLNEVVREKIAALLANEIDNILRDATV